MRICPQCREESPERARFCLACGTALAPTPAGEEERKVVSILFVDLVGFTASSDRADPEDVRARLHPYHAGVKKAIEHFGGTVEKFVGDAVMAAFGAPVAHEDDAERAVRAGLRILEAIEELNEAEPGLGLSVRAAVNTGEAVVALAARPAEGEGFVTGDVVNTAPGSSERGRSELSSWVSRRSTRPSTRSSTRSSSRSRSRARRGRFRSGSRSVLAAASGSTSSSRRKRRSSAGRTSSRC